MKKIPTVLIIGFLLLNALGAAALSTTIINDRQATLTIHDSVEFQQTLFDQSESSQYLSLQMKECSTFLASPGKPKLPKMVKTIELPFGVTDVTVEATPSDKSIQSIEKQIQPATQLLPLTVYDYTYLPVKSIKDESVYQSSSPYPSSWCSYKVGCGLNKQNEHVTFVTIDLYPIRYVPLDNTLIMAEQTDITIKYKEPEQTPFLATNAHDLIIIAPEVFSSALEPFKCFFQSFFETVFWLPT